jgi:hypothetical protein
LENSLKARKRTIEHGQALAWREVLCGCGSESIFVFPKKADDVLVDFGSGFSEPEKSASK